MAKSLKDYAEAARAWHEVLAPQVKQEMDAGLRDGIRPTVIVKWLGEVHGAKVTLSQVNNYKRSLDG